MLRWTDFIFEVTKNKETDFENFFDYVSDKANKMSLNMDRLPQIKIVNLIKKKQSG